MNVTLVHKENKREINIHAFFGCERGACDLTLFAQTLFINTTLIPFEIYNVSQDWAYIIPYNDRNPNLVMAS